MNNVINDIKALNLLFNNFTIDDLKHIKGYFNGHFYDKLIGRNSKVDYISSDSWWMWYSNDADRELQAHFLSEARKRYTEIYPNATLIISDDWEGLYVNDTLISEGHPPSVFNEIPDNSDLFGFNINQIRCFNLNQEDQEATEEQGNFPYKLEDFKGTYK